METSGGVSMAFKDPQVISMNGQVWEPPHYTLLKDCPIGYLGRYGTDEFPQFPHL
jgi:hypothetical protein